MIINTMRNIVRFCVCLVLVAMVTRSTWGLKETCADLEFHGFRDRETAKVEEKTYFNVTFYINTAKCTTLPIWFRVKVSYHQANFTVDVCSIIFEVQRCEITDRSSYCRCVDDPNNAVQMYREFNMSGNVSYIWSLSDSTSGQMQKKAQIIFDVSNVDTMKRLQAASPALTTLTQTPSALDPVRYNSTDTDVGTTSPGVTETNFHGVNLQVIFFNSIITVGVTGITILIVIVIAIYIYRGRKGSDSPFLLDIITFKISVFVSCFRDIYLFRCVFSFEFS